MKTRLFSIIVVLLYAAGIMYLYEEGTRESKQLVMNGLVYFIIWIVFSLIFVWFHKFIASRVSIKRDRFWSLMFCVFGWICVLAPAAIYFAQKYYLK